MIPVSIVATGVANTASVCAALGRLDCVPSFVDRPESILDAEFLILPGVGAFAAAMDRLRAAEQEEPLRQRIQAGRPTLAICLGMQLLGASSEESAATPGLGCLPQIAEAMTEEVRVPHMGWNRVEASADGGLLQSGSAYFAHSFRWRTAPVGWTAAWCSHGEPFVAAVERGAVLACQFHPELSGEFGSSLMRRWLAAGGVPC